MNILGAPDSDYIWEFTVVFERNGFYYWLGYFENYPTDEELLKFKKDNLPILVLHNVRVAHKELKVKEN